MGLNSSILFKHILILSMFLNQSEKANYRWERFCLHTDILVISSDVNRNNRKNASLFSRIQKIFGALELHDWHHHTVAQFLWWRFLPNPTQTSPVLSNDHLPLKEKSLLESRAEWLLIKRRRWRKNRLANCKIP